MGNKQRNPQKNRLVQSGNHNGDPKIVGFPKQLSNKTLPISSKIAEVFVCQDATIPKSISLSRFLSSLLLGGWLWSPMGCLNKVSGGPPCDSCWASFGLPRITSMECISLAQAPGPKPPPAFPSWRYGCVWFSGPPKSVLSFWLHFKNQKRVPSKKDRPICWESPTLLQINLEPQKT